MNFQDQCRTVWGSLQGGDWGLGIGDWGLGIGRVMSYELVTLGLITCSYTQYLVLSPQSLNFSLYPFPIP
ncbi:hypothetical protein H6F74_17165 [Trichocoleus sp. FACHB-90]|uniref:hypothetical protein n=1 Tax=Cyanophyceae TaxID=3028117 RepID=UPI001681FB9C|nr:hypothetical protein [Trichocoleus sp. FACHB-90]MBD1927961.1 hypothetical protein [Trichocoleus sp. FACHB-90]